MFNCIMSVLKGKKFSKLIGFASNGASVMTRVKNRVSTLVKGKTPITLSMHCLSYRLALTSEKAWKKMPHMVKYIEIVKRLGKICQFPPKLCRLLEPHDQGCFEIEASVCH